MHSILSLLLLVTVSIVRGNPCDLFANGGTPCVAAHSSIRALFANYDGPLYQLKRTIDNATFDVPPLVAGGFANASAQDAFCGGGGGGGGGSSLPPGFPAVGATVNLVPALQPGSSFRHCYSQGFVTPTDGDDDHVFTIVAALNGEGNAVSFQSLNYPSSYIAPVTSAEPGRVGILEGPSANDASWLVSVMTDGGFSFTGAGGGVLTAGDNLTGICAHSYAPPSASVYLLPPSSSSSAASSPSPSSWSLPTVGYPTAAACQIFRIYDQSPYGNHLEIATPSINNPNDNLPVNASRSPLTVGGHAVYAAYFETGQGYRAVNTSGVARGNAPETLYMLASGTHVNAECCFDYGNAEEDILNRSAYVDGAMESVYFGTADVTGTWCGGEGSTGPWVMADLENGLWACGNGTQNNGNSPFPVDFVFAMVKGGTDGFALKGGDASVAGSLKTLYDGPRPAGYQPMQKGGAIVLGMGGDNVYAAERKRKRQGNKPSSVGVGVPALSIGTFFEGVLTSGYSTDDVDAAVFADVVNAHYGQ